MPREIKRSGSLGLTFEFYLRHVSSSFSASVGMFLSLAFISVLQNAYVTKGARRRLLVLKRVLETMTSAWLGSWLCFMRFTAS